MGHGYCNNSGSDSGSSGPRTDTQTHSSHFKNGDHCYKPQSLCSPYHRSHTHWPTAKKAEFSAEIGLKLAHLIYPGTVGGSLRAHQLPVPCQAPEAQSLGACCSLCRGPLTSPCFQPSQLLPTHSSGFLLQVQLRHPPCTVL